MSDRSPDGSKKDTRKKAAPEEEAVDKDLTSLLELSAILPPASAEELLASDRFPVNELRPVEQVQEFESIDQLGMMDHEIRSEKNSAPPPSMEAVFEDPFQASDVPAEATRIFGAKLRPFDDSFMVSDPNVAAGENAIHLQPEPKFPTDPELNDPRMDFWVEPDQDPNLDFHAEIPNFSLEREAPLPPAETHADIFPEIPPPTTPAENPEGQVAPAGTNASIDGIKNYSERAREASLHSNQKNPFHLWMLGSFDPFARDKLLLFITENPMGLNSSELDRQITAGRVFLPRISEFAGIKLIQDLRDSGLSFNLRPSGRDEDEVLPQGDNVRLQYEPEALGEPSNPLLVFPRGSADPLLWLTYDSIQIVQFLKAEIIEVERSEIFQELLERMTTSLKNKARLKGAAAIGSLVHELKPLRLPSHYQLELKADLLKKI